MYGWTSMKFHQNVEESEQINLCEQQEEVLEVEGVVKLDGKEVVAEKVPQVWRVQIEMEHWQEEGQKKLEGVDPVETYPTGA